jgi:hypothetical protein
MSMLEQPASAPVIEMQIATVEKRVFTIVSLQAGSPVSASAALAAAGTDARCCGRWMRVEKHFAAKVRAMTANPSP